MKEHCVFYKKCSRDSLATFKWHNTHTLCDLHSWTPALFCRFNDTINFNGFYFCAIKVLSTRKERLFNRLISRSIILSRIIHASGRRHFVYWHYLISFNLWKCMRSSKGVRNRYVIYHRVLNKMILRVVFMFQGK